MPRTEVPLQFQHRALHGKAVPQLGPTRILSCCQGGATLAAFALYGESRFVPFAWTLLLSPEQPRRVVLSLGIPDYVAFESVVGRRRVSYRSLLCALKPPFGEQRLCARSVWSLGHGKRVFDPHMAPASVWLGCVLVPARSRQFSII